MKTSLRLILALALATCLSAHAQWATLTASNIQDASGAQLASGEVCVRAVDNDNHPVGLRVGAGAGQAVGMGCANVVNGAITTNVNTVSGTHAGCTGSFCIPDTSQTMPINACLRLTIKDATGVNVTPPGYNCLQPSSSQSWCSLSGSDLTCNLDQYQPNVASQALIQTGPTGPQGPAGAGFIPGLSSDGSSGVTIAGAANIGGSLSAPQITMTGNNSARVLPDSPLGPYSVRLKPILDETGSTATWDNLAEGDGEAFMIGNQACVYFYGAGGTSWSNPTTNGGVACGPDLTDLTPYSGNPILPSGDSKPFVVQNICGASYCMYHQGPGGIWLSTSSDGFTFTQYGLVFPTNATIAHSMYVENGVGYLFYAFYGADYKSHIRVATTTDGKTFTDVGEVAAPAASGWDSGWIAPGSLVKWAGGYVLSYNAGDGTPTSTNLEAGDSGIGLLYSPTLTFTSDWTRYAGNPVIATNTTNDLANNIWRGLLFNDNGTWTIIFNASDNQNFYERLYMAQLDRVQPNVDQGHTTQAYEACDVLNSTNYGTRTDPVGAYKICSGEDIDGLEIYRGLTNPVKVAQIDSRGRITAFGGLTVEGDSNGPNDVTAGAGQTTNLGANGVAGLWVVDDANHLLRPGPTDGSQGFGSPTWPVGPIYSNNTVDAVLGYYIGANKVIPETVNGYQGEGTKIPLPVTGVATLVSGAVTVNSTAACTPSATCVYKLTNCWKNSSTAIGTLSVGQTTAGTSFVIDSLSATNTVVTGDDSIVCWEIN